jgi:23S rRNA (adenine2503-C2)-methyltransferase
MEGPALQSRLHGNGEPLANYEGRRVRHPDHARRARPQLGARRITVSTSGVIPGIRRLAEEALPVGLALSLHATDDTLRDQLVPINKRWPIADSARGGTLLR